MDADGTSDFHGAKAAILIGPRLLITLRDDHPWIGWPGFWDLPGGGREGRESPRETLAREVTEEVALDLAEAEWLWEGAFPSGTEAGATSWFFVLRLPEGSESGIVMGDEGQGWRLVPPAVFLGMDEAVPFLKDRLRVALSSLGEPSGQA